MRLNGQKPKVRFKELLLVIVSVGTIFFAGVLFVTSRNIRLSIEAKAAAASLIEEQNRWAEKQVGNRWTIGGMRLSPNALQMNFLFSGGLSAECDKTHTGPFGIWFSSGYQIQRATTNDTIWTLYRVHSFGFPKKKGLGGDQS
jgi:hypothetical protein